jgi:hypothetical protein
MSVDAACRAGASRARRQAARGAIAAETRWAGHGVYEQIWFVSRRERKKRWRADTKDGRGAEVDDAQEMVRGLCCPTHVVAKWLGGSVRGRTLALR